MAGRLDIIYKSPCPDEEVPLPDYVRTLRHVLIEAYERVREHVGKAQERQEELYNRKVHGEPHKPWTLVWLFNPAIPRGKAKKFHRPWTGPYCVLMRLSESNYCIQNISNHKIKVVHFDHLKPCPSDVRLPIKGHKSSSHQDSPLPPPASGTFLELVEDYDQPRLSPPGRLPIPTRYLLTTIKLQIGMASL